MHVVGNGNPGKMVHYQPETTNLFLASRWINNQLLLIICHKANVSNGRGFEFHTSAMPWGGKQSGTTMSLTASRCHFDRRCKPHIEHAMHIQWRGGKLHVHPDHYLIKLVCYMLSWPPRMQTASIDSVNKSTAVLTARCTSRSKRQQRKCW